MLKTLRSARRQGSLRKRGGCGYLLAGDRLCVRWGRVLVIMGQAITAVFVLVFVGAVIILGPIAFRNKVRKLRSGGGYPFVPGRDCQRCGGWGNINGVPCGHPPTRGPRAVP